MSLWRSAGTSDLSAMACLRSATVLSVDMVIWSLSSLGPAITVRSNSKRWQVAECNAPLTLIEISDEEEAEDGSADVESDMVAGQE